MKILDTQLFMSEVCKGARKDDCAGYSMCLSAAAYMSYVSFSCQGCNRYERTEKLQPELKSKAFGPSSMEDWGA